MLKKSKRPWLVLGIIILFTGSGLVATKKWQKILDEKGIKVFKREVKGDPIRELKGTLVLNATVAEILSVVLDHTRFHEWQKNMIKFQRLKTVNKREFIDYAAFKLPYPVDNRDSVHRVKIKVDEKNKWVHVILKETRHSARPRQKNLVRIPIARARWSLKPIRDGRAAWCEFVGRGDPGGYIPDWLINWLGKYRVVDSIERLQKRLQQRKFNQKILAEYSFIDEW